MHWPTATSFPSTPILSDCWLTTKSVTAPPTTASATTMAATMAPAFDFFGGTGGMGIGGGPVGISP